MSLENKKEINEENFKEENFKEEKFLNRVDNSSCEHSQSGGDGENEILNDLEENDLNELALLGFFNDFTLIDIGIHEFIREVYFEE